MQQKDFTRSTHSWRTVVIAAAIHFVAFVALFFFSIGRTMSRMDTGAGSTLVERIADFGVRVLWYPLLPVIRLLRIRDPGVGGWLIMIGNSLCWGLTAGLAIVLLKRSRPAA